MPQQPEEKHVTKVIVLLDTLIRLNLPNGPSPLISVENTNEAVHKLEPMVSWALASPRPLKMRSITEILNHREHGSTPRNS